MNQIRMIGSGIPNNHMSAPFPIETSGVDECPAWLSDPISKGRERVVGRDTLPAES